MLNANSQTSNGTGLDGRWYLRAQTGATTADRFSIFNNANTELLTIASNGYIGIGTTAPSQLFTVYAGGAQNYAGAIAVIDQGGVAAMLGEDTPGDTNAAGYLRLMYTGTTRTYLTGGTASASFIGAGGGGNLGIGTRTPDQKLDVNGVILASASATTADIMFNANSQTSNGTGLDGRWYLRAQTGVSTADRFGIFNNANTELLTIASNGYIGIGTTAPSQLFTVYAGGAQNYAGAIAVIDQGGVAAMLGEDTPGDTNAAGYLRLMYTGTTRTYLTGGTASASFIGAGGGGNLGIGTKTPNQKLDVNGVILASVSTDSDILILADSDGACNHNPEAGSETVSCSSDVRLKLDIVDASSSLDYLESFHIREYTVRASGVRMVGVIAQELIETHPELVSSNSNGFLMVQQPNPWILVKGIQELASRSAALDALFAGSDPIQAFIDRLKDIVLRVRELVAPTVRTEKLCIEDVCVTRDQLYELLQRNSVAPAVSTPTPDPTPSITPEASPVVEPVISPVESPIALPVESPVTTPEISPTPEPTPITTPAPDITTEPAPAVEPPVITDTVL